MWNMTSDDVNVTDGDDNGQVVGDGEDDNSQWWGWWWQWKYIRHV